MARARCVYQTPGGFVRVYFDRDTGEYIARVPGRPALDYFTDDKQDATQTANMMEGQLAREAFEDFQREAKAAIDASPAHRGAYLLEPNVDFENASDAGHTRDSAAFWIAAKSSAVFALESRCDEQRLPMLKVPKGAA